MRWVGARHIFTDTTTSDESWAVSWERRRSQYVQSYSFPNILLDGWQALKANLCSLKVHTLKKFSSALRAAKLIDIFSRRASRGTAWPLHFKFASYTYELVVQLLLFHPKMAQKAISDATPL